MMAKYRISFRYDGSFQQEWVFAASDEAARERFLNSKIQPEKFEIISVVEIAE